ncbi:sigma-54 dependent transcriptional regulator [Motiliproteus sp. SC1-56]|uniref:sigma-54-dependent transcriptional regulator n=1 Tax=Motiliproteus sp. SC1-56 TaxID=2799565 RepID=UPI001A8E60DA|nr:sigma-54 dependent transcriptional regulator [Motiliproteus sp. SC1-56]
MRFLNVLIIDDEPALRQILGNAVSKAGHKVQLAENGTQALEVLEKESIDVAICDIRMPDMTGIEVVSKAKAAGIETAFLVMTAYASVNTAIDAMRCGAYDYMIKPLRNEDVLNRLSQLAAMIGLKSENQTLRRLVLGLEGTQCTMDSPAMQRIERLVAKVAVTDSTVLITGESGTGKGVTARAIHQASLRGDAPFIPVNCGAIPENLLESEFFGHTKGAFTGATKTKKGLFQEADGGTLFLDEIGELPLSLQVKLLHVLEQNEVRPVGSEKMVPVDVRLVAATNRDLDKMVESGEFREDLFFRLNIFNIELPPLRERKEDISALLDFFLQREAKKLGMGNELGIDPDARELLCAYNWPGNIRELENVIARALILVDDNEIQVTDLPQQLLKPVRGQGSSAVNDETLREQVRQFEIEVIKKTIDEQGGDRRKAAKALGLGLSSLYRKLEESA